LIAPGITRRLISEFAHLRHQPGERDAFRRGFRHLGALDLSTGSLEADLVNQSAERLNEEIRRADLAGIFLRDSLPRVPSRWRVGV
jgi:hypothetical protein